MVGDTTGSPTKDSISSVTPKEAGGTTWQSEKKIGDISEISPVTIGKSTTSKIPTFDGTGPRELYHKQFKAAAAHNQWNDAEKPVALVVLRY